MARLNSQDVRARAPCFVIARRINSLWRKLSENNLSKSRTAVKIAVNPKPFADA